MARDLATYEAPDNGDVSEGTNRRIDRSIAQAIASAIAALAVTMLVVGASTSALVRDGTASGSDFETGTITLVDDDQDRSLVDLADMAPGRPVTECINIAYTGSVLPVVVSLSADLDGDVAEFVDIQIEAGSDGGFGACSNFTPDSILFTGRLDELAEEGLELDEIRRDGAQMSFRFTFDLADDSAAAGRSGTVDFVWEAVPS